MFDGDTRLFKIGVSRKLRERYQQLCLVYDDLTLVWTWPVPRDAYRVETALHHRFAEYRQTGEWFDLPGTRVVEDITAALDDIYL